MKTDVTVYSSICVFNPLILAAYYTSVFVLVQKFPAPLSLFGDFNFLFSDIEWGSLPVIIICAFLLFVLHTTNSIEAGVLLGF